jgi:hypothetical protein
MYGKRFFILILSSDEKHCNITIDSFTPRLVEACRLEGIKTQELYAKSKEEVL